MSLVKNKFFLGNILSPKDERSAHWKPGHGLWLERKPNTSKYFIKRILTNKELEKAAMRCRSAEVLDYREFIFTPTFCDLHFHWVQDDVRSMPKNDLLFWLKNHTWPSEQKFESVSYTRKKIKEFSKELLRAGTMTGGCYSSIHEHATRLGIDLFPGELIVGNVQMTMNSPDYLLQSKSDCLKVTRSLAKKFKSRYAVTPRFAITTHPEVMKKSAFIAKKNNSFIQTHLSETKQEIEAVMDIYSKIPGFEKVKTYTEVYELSGILGPKTIMGHGIHLNSKELKLLRKTKTAIAHCPTSNAPKRMKGLGSGLFNIKDVMKAKISWALGSDIGAGPYLSMVDVMNSFVTQQKASGLANFTHAFFRSTLAGESILKSEHRRGSLDEGKEGNFLVFDYRSISSLKNMSSEEVLKSLFFLGPRKRATCEGINKGTFLQGNKLFQA